MNRADLIDRMSSSAGISKAAADRALKAFTESITGELAKGESVVLLGFGTFDILERQERSARNPQTGQLMVIPAKVVPKFKPGRDLKVAVEKGNSAVAAAA